MALLFSDVVNSYNAKKRDNLSVNELSNKVADFLDDIELDNDNNFNDNSYAFYDIATKEQRVLPQKVFVASIASEYYSKAKEDIANTKVGNKSVRKKNFQQVMQESFFYGSNRFGNNFIA